MNPKVSILVPIYGVEKYIQRCAISLFEQTFQDIEYIFVNDCTPDKSIDILKEVLKRYPHRKSQVKVINHEVNKGLAGARNTGVKNASGEYILHVDSDDYLELNAIELLIIKAAEINADVVIFGFFIEWTKTKIEVITEYPIKDKVKLLNGVLSGDFPTSVWNKLIRRSIYTQNEIFTQEGLNYGEDYAVIPRILYNSNKIDLLNIALYHYMQINNTAYTKSFSLKSMNNLVEAISINKNYFNSLINYSDFSFSIDLFKLRRKIDLFIKINHKDWNKVSVIFQDLNVTTLINRLSTHERLIYRLYSKGNFYLLKKYLFFYKEIFKGYQKIKNRY